MSLTEDDKRWIAVLLDQRLTQHSERTEQYLDQRLTEHSERTEQYLDQRLREHRELIERVETSLLTEFHKWASPTEARLRTHTAALRAIDLEMESLNDRVKQLEGDAA